MSAASATGIALRRGGRALLDDARIDLRPGEVLGIVGPNGAGKSTLLRVLAGLERPDAGAVTLLGRPMRDWPMRDRAAAIGHLPQHFQPHWDWRADELLRLGAGRAPRPVPPGALAAEFSLYGLLDRRWSTLSGGERARVLAAMVLAAAPRVILADEPAAAMDPGQAAATMAHLARRAAAGAAVAVVLHDLNLAAGACHRLALMAAGRVRLTGPPGEVLADPALDEAYGTRFRRIRPGDGGMLVLPG